MDNNFSAGLDSDRNAALQNNLLIQGNQVVPNQPYGYPQQGSPQQGYPQQGYPQQGYVQPYPQQGGMIMQQPMGAVIIQTTVNNEKAMQILQMDQKINAQFSVYSCVAWTWMICIMISVVIVEILLLAVGSFFGDVGNDNCNENYNNYDNECNNGTQAVEGIVIFVAFVVAIVGALFAYFQWTGIVALRDKNSGKARSYRIFLIVALVLSTIGFFANLAQIVAATMISELLAIAVYAGMLHQTTQLIVLLNERDQLMLLA